MSSTPLLDFNANIWTQVVRLLPAETSPGRRANALTCQSIALVITHRPQPALSAAEDAVALYEALSKDDTTYLWHLAYVLNARSHVEAALARLDSARDTARRALELRLRLAAERPQDMRPDLAVSYLTMANRSADLADWTAAADESKIACDISRQLSEQDQSFQAQLGECLANHTNMLREAANRIKNDAALRDRQLQAALTAGQEAIKIARDAAARRPDTFLPILAVALTNVSAVYGNLEQPAEAFSHIERANKIYEDLVSKWPNVYSRLFAKALTNESQIQMDLGDTNRASAKAERALEILQRLFAESPDLIRADLASAVLMLANSTANVDPGNSYSLVKRAITTLAPEFARRRSVVESLMASLMEGALRFSQAKGSEAYGEAVAMCYKYFPEAPQ